MTGKQNSKGFILVFLGMLSAFGPFVMDMYLPTLPAMSDFFQTTSSRVLSDRPADFWSVK